MPSATERCYLATNRHDVTSQKKSLYLSNALRRYIKFNKYDAVLKDGYGIVLGLLLMFLSCFVVYRFRLNDLLSFS
jgi:hypothetical protein